MLLVLAGASNDSVGLKTMPWAPIVIVSGVTVLVTLLEASGIDLFTTILASTSSLETITRFTTALTGVISIFGEHLGVVLPASSTTMPVSSNSSAAATGSPSPIR